MGANNIAELRGMLAIRARRNAEAARILKARKEAEEAARRAMAEDEAARAEASLFDQSPF